MSSLTFQTKAPDSLTPFLEAMASRASGIERQLYQDLLDGKSAKDLKRDYQVQYGINARQFNSIHRVLQGKIGSRVECHKRQVQELSERITDARESN